MAEEEKNVNSLAIIEQKDLSLAGANNLNSEQLALILKKTPKQYIKKRPAKGGGQWDYVTGGYMKKVLNLMFGWDWDFEIIDSKLMIECKEVIVLGKLTCRSEGNTIVKMQYGNKEIIYKKKDKEDDPVVILSIGNDIKAAATDALKKCASELGIAADIYNKEDFREIKVQVEDLIYDLENLEKLYAERGDKLSEDDQMNCDRIIETKDETSYKKAIQILNQIKL